MNVFYEEDGGFKVARVMEDIGTSMQVEAASGKRSKIKSNAVLLRFDSALGELMPAAEKLAADIDTDFLYEVCGTGEFGFEDLAFDYFGHKPPPAEAAACALKLHGAPMYFYKRGKGRYQKAPEENLRAALASIERKKREAEDMAAWVTELKSGILPEAMRPHVTQLLYKPDRNTLISKACDAAVAETGLPLPQLFFAAGAWPQHTHAPHLAQHDYHVGKFLAEHFPRGAALTIDAPLHQPTDLPAAEVLAYSIDDAETTEIDDAFSWRDLGDGTVEVGIHIAAPALWFDTESAFDLAARARLSTVYFPGAKITMLPENAIGAATLAEGERVPVVTLYARFDRTSHAVLATRTAVETVRIARNLRLHNLDEWLTADAVADESFSGAGIGPNATEFCAELVGLYRIAVSLKTARGAKDSVDYVDYNFAFAPGRAKVHIHPRVRGSPVDTLVAEMMIFANSQWGKLLAENGVAGIYRAQQNMKTRMTTDALPHEGLGVPYYAWSSSPLRRYVDLVNQRQIIAVARGEQPLYPRRSPVLNEIARTFDMTYDAYAEFQRGMERFWSLRYLEQEGIASFNAMVLRDEIVRASHLPMTVRLKASPNLPGKSAVLVNIESIDYWSIGGEFSSASPSQDAAPAHKAA
jgi:exoribonuclease-2